jgi:hypothetical protein
MSTEIMEQINKILENELSERHSYFQLKYFVIGKEPTLQGKMWQCIRELGSRKDSLDAVEIENYELNDKKELIDIQIEKNNLTLKNIEESSPEGDLNARECRVITRQLERQKQKTENALVDLNKKQNYILEEANFFLETFKSLEEIEPLKDFDDLPSQQHYWDEKLSNELNLKLLLQRAPDVELVKTIMSLNNNSPTKQQTIKMLENIQQQALVQIEQTKIEDNKNG